MSGSNVAYHLRVNKYVDRCLFAEALAMLERAWPINRYAYVSMGGGYLEDFRVIHQSFGIDKMLSFDRDEWVVQRQMFNRPYGFIRCEKASSTEIITELHNKRRSLVGSEGNVIVWLDYTQPSKRLRQLEDLEDLVGKLTHGDVFRITVNAQRKTLGSPEDFQNEIEAGTTEHRTINDWWNEKLVDQLDSYFPLERNGSDFIISEAAFAMTLAKAIRRAAHEGLTSRPELIPEAVLAVAYADGEHQMLTVTGVIVEDAKRAAFRDACRWDSWILKPGVNWDSIVELSVPHLTLRERQAVHDMMYYGHWPSWGNGVKFLLDKNLTRHSKMIDQYRTHYLRYPTFTAVDVL